MTSQKFVFVVGKHSQVAETPVVSGISAAEGDESTHQGVTLRLAFE